MLLSLIKYRKILCWFIVLSMHHCLHCNCLFRTFCLFLLLFNFTEKRGNINTSENLVCIKYSNNILVCSVKTRQENEQLSTGSKTGFEIGFEIRLIKWSSFGCWSNLFDWFIRFVGAYNDNGIGLYYRLGMLLSYFITLFHNYSIKGNVIEN